jgi:pimeloyl-ACP methyl ester carboxylesterase
MAGDVAGVIRGLGLTTAGIVGHSMGAATAEVTAAHYPELVKCVVLEDPPLRYPLQAAADWSARLGEIQAEAKKRKEMTTEEMVAYSPKINPNMASWAEIELAPWAEAKRLVNLRVMDGLRLHPLNWLEIVPKITCPTLLLAADPAHSPAATPEAVRHATALNPNIRAVTVLGAGHNIRREAFDTYIAEVTKFLSGIHW